MDVTLVSLSAVSLALVPVVIALTQVTKSFITDERYIPIVSLGFGVATAFFVPAASITLTILQGILVGLSASGLFSGAKAAMASRRK